jgi:hypothetical protein
VQARATSDAGWVKYSAQKSREAGQTSVRMNKAELRKALSDSILSEDEEHILEQLRLTFNLTKEHAQAIKSRAVEEQKAKSN